MRSKRKKVAYMMFLLITILMFLHSWKLSLAPMNNNYAKKQLGAHAMQTMNHPVHQVIPIVVHA